MLNVTESERQEFRDTYSNFSHAIVKFCENYYDLCALGYLKHCVDEMIRVIGVFDKKSNVEDDRIEYIAVSKYVDSVDDAIAINLDMYNDNNLYGLAIELADLYNRFYATNTEEK